MARSLLIGSTPDTRDDPNARLLLRQDEEYVRSQLSSANIRRAPPRVVLSEAAARELDQYLLAL